MSLAPTPTPRRVEGLLDARDVESAVRNEQLWIDDGQQVLRFLDTSHRAVEASGGAGSGRSVAPLDGAVLAVRATEGQPIKKGEVLLVLEAMKMEHRITAAVDGVVAAVHVKAGQQVKTRQLLVEIAHEGEGEE